MDSEFMQTIARGLAAEGVKVVRFEFPYMQERRVSGKKRPPNRQHELIEAFKKVIEDVNQPCVLMGKSMGGRMASILASMQPLNPNVLGVVALGYPFHPQKKPEKLRIDHMPDINIPMLIIQGTRDALGEKTYIETLPIPNDIQIHWLEDGDHDLKPRVKSGLTHEQHMSTAIKQSAQFIKQCYTHN